jgi:hypothetical protein
MENDRLKKLPDGTTIVDDDPYIVFNDKMKEFASTKFKEAEERGYTSTEDKARYLSGRIFEMSPYGIYNDGKSLMDKNAIELFNGLMSDDKEKHYLACAHKAWVQRALIESQGVKTRNVSVNFIPGTYPLKPVASDEIRNKNAIIATIGKPLARVGLSLPHFTVDAWTCKDENQQKECDWKTMDANFDDTTRMLKTKPDIDPDITFGESYPSSVKDWLQNNHYPNMLATTLYSLAENPLTKGVIRAFLSSTMTSIENANEHVK